MAGLVNGTRVNPSAPQPSRLVQTGSELADPLAELQVGRGSDGNDDGDCEKGHLTYLWDLLTITAVLVSPRALLWW